MSDAYRRIYKRNVFRLAKTMVIKSELTANYINRWLEGLGVSVSDDRSTWKYYMNLAGEYHNKDKVMSVRSMDTLEMIDFTKENLAVHRSTAQNYAYGTQFYNNLVNEYPNQEMLILGILNPVLKEVSIPAEDNQIIYYDESLVEPNEYTLIADLQKWVDAYFTRWSIDGFSLVEELYPAAQLGVLFTHLPLEIINQRNKRRGTNEVHSYHVREYLASHGRLDRFFNDLSLEQRLFLYRNIKYIKRYPGHSRIFKLLIDKLMSKRNLPLNRYVLRHNLSNLPDPEYMVDDGQDRSFEIVTGERLKPEAEFYREDLNNARSDEQSDVRGLTQTMERIDSFAPRNNEYRSKYLDSIVSRVEYSTINRVPTKILESSILDTSDTAFFGVEDTIFNHWIYLAYTGDLSVAVNITNPATGDIAQLDIKDALLAYIYAINAANSLWLETIPPIVARNVQRPIIPSMTDLLRLVDVEVIPENEIAEVREMMPEIKIMQSLGAFYEYGLHINFVQNMQRLWWDGKESLMAHSMAEQVGSHLYQDYYCDFGIGDNFEVFLSGIGLRLFEFNANDLLLTANEIYNEVTGLEGVQTSPIERLQESILGIMNHLTSYSVNFIGRINTDSYTVLNTGSVRMTPVSSYQRENRYIDIRPPEPLNLSSRSKSEFDLIYDGIDTMNVSTPPGTTHADIDLGGYAEITSITHTHVQIPAGGMDVFSFDTVESN